MNRYVRMGIFISFGAVAALTFRVERAVVDMRQELRTVREQSAAEHQMIEVLKAEWSYMVRPDRIRELASKNLEFSQTASAEQIVTLAALPEAIKQEMDDDQKITVLSSVTPALKSSLAMR